ncbi:MAG: signal peptidase II [Deltaproteobacteria bacterium]|nr:signal peptidase II [Deltaproteobacteria bacterium]
MKKQNKLITFATLAIGGFILDMGTKLWAQKALVAEYINPAEQSPFSLNLTLAMNKGSAFGMFTGIPGARWILTAIGIGALFFIYYLYKRPETKSRLYLIGLGILTGGALGNLVDRIIFGHVTDFIQFWGFPSVDILWPWPTFNVADVLLLVGVGLMFIYTLFFAESEKNEKK